MANKPQEYLQAWLAVSGPDEWHRVARSWNWDAGCDILSWIIDQDNCDRATALLVFWLSAPDWYLQFRDRADLVSKQAYNTQGYDLAMKVLSNWRAGRYVTTKFSTEGEVQQYALSFGNEEKRLGLENLPFVVPQDMRRDVRGRLLDWSNYAEGYPPHLVEFFREAKINF